MLLENSTYLALAETAEMDEDRFLDASIAAPAVDLLWTEQRVVLPPIRPPTPRLYIGLSLHAVGEITWGHDAQGNEHGRPC